MQFSGDEHNIETWLGTQLNLSESMFQSAFSCDLASSMLEPAVACPSKDNDKAYSRSKPVAAFSYCPHKWDVPFSQVDMYTGETYGNLLSTQQTEANCHENQESSRVVNILLVMNSPFHGHGPSLNEPHLLLRSSLPRRQMPPKPQPDPRRHVHRE